MIKNKQLALYSEKKITEVVTVNERAFKNISSGKKRIEVRKNSKFFSNFEPGINFYFLDTKSGSKILVETKRINCYKNLNDLVENETLELVNPYPDVDDSFSYYTKIYKGKIQGDWISIHFERN
jgi:ASC-1-like (ASCH) protein